MINSKVLETTPGAQQTACARTCSNSVPCRDFVSLNSRQVWFLCHLSWVGFLEICHVLSFHENHLEISLNKGKSKLLPCLKLFLVHGKKIQKNHYFSVSIVALQIQVSWISSSLLGSVFLIFYFDLSYAAFSISSRMEWKLFNRFENEAFGRNMYSQITIILVKSWHWIGLHMNNMSCV